MPVYNFCANSAQPFRPIPILKRCDCDRLKKLSQLTELVKIAIQCLQPRTPVEGDLCFNSLQYDQCRIH